MNASLEKELLILFTDAWVLIVILILCMAVAYFAGRFLGNYRLKLNPDKPFEGNSIIMTAFFALLALLLGFTFHLAGNRHDIRRQLIIDEANYIRNVIHLADMYDEQDREVFRKYLKQYLEVRIAYFQVGADMNKIVQLVDSTNMIYARIWERGATLSKDSKYATSTKQMIPALNAMSDITVTRKYASIARIPDSIIVMLFILATVNLFFTGYAEFGRKRKDWLLVIGYCVITALVVYNIIDLDRPRRGFILLNEANRSLIELRYLFK